jgi:LmbE family N-acetylglucosaminyl deacetylase/SAM-dependent methyltransferase
VVIFDPRLPGTAAQTWAADGRLASLPRLQLEGVSEVIVVGAHPDDETLGAGGLMAEATRRGIPVRVFVVTDGAASHPQSPSTSPARLAGLRRREVAAAVGLLAPGATVTFLDFADGAIAESREPVFAAVRAIVEGTRSSALMAAPWRGDGHRDHRVLGEICAEATTGSGLRLLEYPIWMWHWATPDAAQTPWDRLAALPLSDRTVVSKRRAIALHASQVAPLSPEPGDESVLHPLFLSNFDLDGEIFVTEPTSDEALQVTLGESYFDSVYARRLDPWGFETRWYEQRKRAVTLASLPRKRYRTALEIGCSIGVLTESLAERCDRLLSVDVSSAAVERTRERLTASPHVTVERIDVGTAYPDGPFDLVLLSEVGYYFSREDLGALFRRIDASLTPDGTLLLCHWRHPVGDYPLSGDEVHAATATLDRLHRIVEHREDDFVLEVFSRDPRSVAGQTGLLA